MAQNAQQRQFHELITNLGQATEALARVAAQTAQQQTDDGLHRTPSVSAHKCITLPLDAQNPTPEVQELINQWHSQSLLHAFTKTPLWLFLQLPRFFYHAPGWPVKQAQAYILPYDLQLPQFVNSDTTDVNWVPYRVLAYIQHHGNVPTSGHYTTVAQRHPHESWLLDDDKDPTLLTSAQLDLLLIVGLKLLQQFPA